MARRTIKRASLEIGKAMAEATLRQHRSAMRARQRNLAKGRNVITRQIVVTTGRAAKPTRIMTRTLGTLVAEGDSWFDYPLHDILTNLEILGYEVESVAHRGDTVEDMAYAGGQLSSFLRSVEKVLRTGVPTKAILLSGGGNDVAGDHFEMLLNHAFSGTPGLNAQIVDAVINQRIRDAYVTILNAITTLCQQYIGQTVPILVHGYGYAVPDGRGFLGGWWLLPGPWLKPGFTQKGYASLAKNQAIVATLIDRFNAMLQGLAGRAPFGHVKYVDLRGTLPSGRNYKNWWANELHPTARGFQAVAAKFAAKL
jgi:lysophospholipase L1-like esterase